jgi:hypothetical protein
MYVREAWSPSLVVKEWNNVRKKYTRRESVVGEEYTMKSFLI